METKTIDKLTFLGLENLSLKLQIATLSLQNSRKTVADLNGELQVAAAQALKDAGLSEDEWGIDLNTGKFAKKE